LLISDLAPLLNSPEGELQEILGTLTRLLDGEGLYSAKGVHGRRGYGGHGEDYRFAFVAASTPLKRHTWKIIGVIGARVLTVSVEQPKERAEPPTPGVRDKVGNAAGLVDSWMSDLWDRYGYRGVKWETLDANIEQELWNISTLVGRWRAPTPDEGEIVVIERPYRLYHSLMALVRGHALLDDRTQIDDSDLKMVRRVALDSMPDARRRLLRAMLAVGTITLDEAGQILRVSTQAASKYHLTPLVEQLGVVLRHGDGNTDDTYRFEIADKALLSGWAQQWAEAVR